MRSMFRKLWFPMIDALLGPILVHFSLTFGTLWGPLWDPFGPMGCHLGPSWAHLGTLGLPFGPFLIDWCSLGTLLGSFWVAWVALWTHLGHFWNHLSAIWRRILQFLHTFQEKYNYWVVNSLCCSVFQSYVDLLECRAAFGICTMLGHSLKLLKPCFKIAGASAAKRSESVLWERWHKQVTFAKVMIMH